MIKIKKIITGVFLIGGVLFLAGCDNQNSTNRQTSSNSNTSSQSIAQNIISIKNFAFNPAVIKIKKGDTVTWINEDSVTHMIKSDTFNSDNLSSGSQFQFTFNEAGIFDYSCGIHPSMKGQIIVE